MREAKMIYGIFEGGGAKGIAHLGAVAAVEKLGMHFAGVAGASAGAFVAALVAAGYRSDELFDPSTPTRNLCSTNGLDPLELLGVHEWQAFNRVRRHAPWLIRAALFAGVPGSFLTGPRCMLTLAALRRGLGLFSTDRIRDFVNARIRERLADLWAEYGKNPAGVPDLVRFVDLDYNIYTQLRPLKIIATDILQMRPVLFDHDHTPHVPIGDAVAASIAIPTVFRPVTVRDLPKELGQALFVDGGLVSNLPFWVFGEEKMAMQRTNLANSTVPVVAFMLVDDQTVDAADAGAATPSFFQFLTKSIRTAILGSQSTAQNLLLRDVVRVPLITRLPVLGFDQLWPAIRGDYITGRQCATGKLGRTLQLKPRLLDDQLRQLTDQARAQLDQVRNRSGKPPVSHLRAYLLEPSGEQSLRVAYGHNMDNDADDQLAYDRRSLGAGEAFTNSEVRVMTFPPSEPAFMTKYERALLRPGLRSALYIPIFSDIEVWERPPGDRPSPLGILALDSEDDLLAEFANPAFLSRIIEHSVLISVAFAME